MDGSLTSLFMGGYNPPQSSTPTDKEGELQHLLVCACVELESARAAVQTQSKLHEEKLFELEQVLKTLRKERDEARQQFFDLFQALSSLSNNNNDNNNGAFPCLPAPVGSPVAVHERDMDSFSSASMASPELPEQQLPWAGFDDLDSELIGWKHPSNLFDDLPHLDFMDGLDADLDKVMMAPNQVQPAVKHVSPPVSSTLPSSSTSSTTSSNNVSPLKRPLPEVASPVAVKKKKHLPEPPEANMAVMLRSLPERGKLLQAVMQAGPLLQNLLVAGPLPQWRHPPPVMEPVDIPKVNTKSPIAGLCSNTVHKSQVSLHHHHHHMPREISWDSPFQYAKIH